MVASDKNANYSLSRPHIYFPAQPFYPDLFQQGQKDDQYSKNVVYNESLAYHIHMNGTSDAARPHTKAKQFTITQQHIANENYNSA